MDNSTVWIMIILGLVLAVSVVYLWVYLSANVLNPSGKNAYRATTRLLSRYAGIRRFKVLQNVTLSIDGKTAVVENMLIGFFGILIVHTCGARGEYYGTVDGDSWIITDDTKRTSIKNPLKEQQKAMALMRQVLAGNKLYNIPIENVVALTSRAKKTGLFITNTGQILMPGKLGGYLGKTKFDKDIGLDVEKIAAVFSSQQ